MNAGESHDQRREAHPASEQSRLRQLGQAMRSFCHATKESRSTLLETIVRTTARAVDASCTLYLASPDASLLRPTVSHLLAATAFDPEDRPLAAPPALLHSDASDPLCEAFRSGAHSLAGGGERDRALCVPLTTGARPLGALRLVRPGAAAAFSADDIGLALELGDCAALSLTQADDAAQHESEATAARAMTERLRVISELSQQFAAATGDSRRLLDLVCRRLGEVVGEAVSIRMITADGTAFETPGAGYDPDPARLAFLQTAMESEPQRVGEGISGRVAATGSSLLIPTFTEAQLAAVDDRFRKIIERIDLASVVAVPLRAHGRVIGAATIFRTSRHPPYTIDDQRLVEDLVAHASLAIANSRLLGAAEAELAERRRTEEALQRTEEQLRQAQKMDAAGKLAGGVAHDFNNLLSVILSTCELLLDDLAHGSPMRSDVGEIQKAGLRASDLTRQLLAFSRLQIVEPRIHDLTEVARSMEAMLRRLAGDHITLRFVPPAGSARVRADRGHLEQVILNLVGNARDAMPEGGTTTITWSQVELGAEFAESELGLPAGAYVRLAVEDDGTGMDRATQRRIFEPFFTTKTQGKGTGLGLSTVFGIVKQGGGGIRVESALGMGSVFEVYLPTTTEVEARREPEPRPTTLVGTETILLTDDEEPVRAVARTVLDQTPAPSVKPSPNGERPEDPTTPRGVPAREQDRPD